jgi:hypothetical protein
VAQFPVRLPPTLEAALRIAAPRHLLKKRPGAWFILAGLGYGVALIDVAETMLELGQSLPVANPQLCAAEMDIEVPIYLHLRASAAVEEVTVWPQ